MKADRTSIDAAQSGAPAQENTIKNQDSNAHKYSALISGCILMLCIGILYVWSVFLPYVMAEFGWAAGDVGMTSAIMIAMSVLGNIVGGMMQGRFGPRVVVYIGVTMFSLGMYLTSLLSGSSPLMLYLTYSVISGFGSGLAYTNVLSVLQKWFAARSGLVTGLVVGCFGLSVVVLSPIVESLLAAYNVRPTFCILAVAFVIICYICSFFIRKPSDEYYLREATKVTKAGDLKQYTPIELLKTPMAYLIMISMFISTAPYLILVPYIKTIAMGRGMSSELALAAVMLTGIANSTGRIVMPALSDKISRTGAFITCSVIGIASCIFMIFAEGPFYLVTVFLIAFSFGGSLGTNPVITTQIFGAKNSATNYGVIMISLAASSIIFGKIASSIGTTSIDGFTTIFILCAIVSVIPIIAMLILRGMYKKQGRVI